MTFVAKLMREQFAGKPITESKVEAALVSVIEEAARRCEVVDEQRTPVAYAIERRIRALLTDEAPAEETP